MDSAIEEAVKPATTGDAAIYHRRHLTAIQWELYREIVRECQKTGGIPPGIRDLQKTCEISSTSVVNYHLNRLALAGLIRRLPGLSRGIVVVGCSWNPPPASSWTMQPSEVPA